ncbi:MAG: hypothetical protein GC131_07875 [Alphaproteobacteria bacterium]|nr:hypothetical protein [Alphaproteobacteria bacterium]
MNRVIAHCLTARRALAVLGLAGMCFVLPAPAQAAISSDSDALSQALTSGAATVLFAREDQSSHGFSLSSSFFSGRASGNDTSANRGVGGLGVIGDFSTDRLAELEGDQRVYALLIDGSYDFNYDFGTGLPISPYVGGGVGMAMADAPVGSRTNLRGGDMVPLFRVGGGVVYRLGKDWDLSLNYKAGFSGGDTTTFTGRNQNDQVDLQVLDLGMKFKF